MKNIFITAISFVLALFLIQLCASKEVETHIRNGEIVVLRYVTKKPLVADPYFLKNISNSNRF